MVDVKAQDAEQFIVGLAPFIPNPGERMSVGVRPGDTALDRQECLSYLHLRAVKTAVRVLVGPRAPVSLTVRLAA